MLTSSKATVKGPAVNPAGFCFLWLYANIIGMRGHKILILGVGNALKQDDGLGPALIGKLKAVSGKQKAELIDAGTAPENFTGKIKQIAPEKLVIIDAINFGGEPGSIKTFKAKDIAVQSLSTHNVSLKTFVNYLKTDLPDMVVEIIGVQPKQTGFGEGLSPEVKKGVEKLCMSLA